MRNAPAHPERFASGASQRTLQQEPERVVDVVLEGRLSDGGIGAGSIACDKRALLLGFADGALEAVTLKPDGKGPMSGCDWARGLRLDADASWEAC